MKRLKKHPFVFVLTNQDDHFSGPKGLKKCFKQPWRLDCHSFNFWLYMRFDQNFSKLCQEVAQVSIYKIKKLETSTTRNSDSLSSFDCTNAQAAKLFSKPTPNQLNCFLNLHQIKCSKPYKREVLNLIQAKIQFVCKVTVLPSPMILDF